MRLQAYFIRYFRVMSAFEGGLKTWLMAGMLAIAPSQKIAAQAAAKAPESINPRVLQVDMTKLNVEFLRPWEKQVTQAQLTADSTALVRQINTFNRFQSTPNGWEGRGATPEEAHRLINHNLENFVVDKIRFKVATGQMPPPPRDPVSAGVADGVQMKLGRVERVEPVEPVEPVERVEEREELERVGVNEADLKKFVELDRRINELQKGIDALALKPDSHSQTDGDIEYNERVKPYNDLVIEINKMVADFNKTYGLILRVRRILPVRKLELEELEELRFILW